MVTAGRPYYGRLALRSRLMNVLSWAAAGAPELLGHVFRDKAADSKRAVVINSGSTLNRIPRASHPTIWGGTESTIIPSPSTDFVAPPKVALPMAATHGQRGFVFFLDIVCLFLLRPEFFS